MIEPEKFENPMLPAKMRALASQVVNAFKEAAEMVAANPSLREDPAYRRLCGEAAKFSTSTAASLQILFTTMEEPGRKELIEFEKKHSVGKKK